jgi:hypothetical protein
MIFSLVSKKTTQYAYSHLGTGYCSDWVHLPEGKYPDRLSADNVFYDADPVQECMNRCLDAYGKAGVKASTADGKIGNQAFYLKSNGGCACAIGDCSSRVSSGYESYAIISARSSFGF